MITSCLDALLRFCMRPPRLTAPIFVVGTARSGTTFLGTQLGTLPDILHCPFELKDIWSQVGGVPMASPKTGDRINPPLTERDVRRDQAKNLMRAFRRRMEALDPVKAARPGCRLLNKNPHLANKMGLVQGLFPDADFIWIFRPLCDVVASLKVVFQDIHERAGVFHVWPDRSLAPTPRGLHMWKPGDDTVHAKDRMFPGGDVLHLAEYWLEANGAIRDSITNIPGAQQYRVDHRELVRMPQNAFLGLCRFLRQPEAHAASMAGAVGETNGRWRERLADDEVERLRLFVADRWSEIASVLPGLYQSEDDVFG